ncbi:MAG: hypothetical protein GTO02_23185, partial [Candidatus Dadabacteria bacterium]|nr:hypothetical protein [Candidatus Dadabacteria bacterium]NIQ17176.1 hypothetical protein [Candidatus Dadabacteria bacterium]
MNISKILIFFLAFFISTNLAYAVNYTVDDDSDGPANAANCEAEPPDVEDGGCRLRDAIAAADDGDTIDFILNGATI